MRRIYNLLISEFLFLLFTITLGCNQKSNETSTDVSKVPGQFEIKYSSKFFIRQSTDGPILTVKSPFKNSGDYRYLLHSGKTTKQFANVHLIQVPVKKIIPVSTSYIPMIESLGEESSIKGFPNTDLISSVKVRKLINEGKITDIGNESDFNIEKIAEIDPDLIIGYAINSTSAYDALENFDIDVLFNADYMEQHPLGRAEWIKVFGLLFNKYELADSIFKSVEARYDSIKNINRVPNSMDSVISGSLYGDSWYLPGGNNYGSKLLKDGGFEYCFSGDTSGSFLALSFEKVYEVSHNAEFWLSPAPFPDLEALARSDERYKNFKAFQLGNVWCYDKSLGEKGGNNYLELGYLRPDIILNDLIYIRNPDPFPDYTTFFYRKLE